MNAHALRHACEQFVRAPLSPHLAATYSCGADVFTGTADGVESAECDLDRYVCDMDSTERAVDLPTPCAPEATGGAAKPRTSKNKIARFLLECSGGDPDDCGKGSIREKAAIYEEHCNDQNVSPYNIALGQEFMRCIDATYRTRDRLRELRDQVIEYCEIEDAEERSAFLREHPEMPLLPEMAHLHEAVARDDTSEELSTYLLRNSGRSAADVQKHKNTKHTKSAVRVFTMLCDEVREDPRGSKSRAKAFMQAAGKLTTTKLQAVEKLTVEFVSLTDRDRREEFLERNPDMILLEEEVRPPNSDSLAEHHELHQEVRAGRDTGCLRVARADGDDHVKNAEMQVDEEHASVSRRRTRVSKRQREDGAEDEEEGDEGQEEGEEGEEDQDGEKGEEGEEDQDGEEGEEGKEGEKGKEGDEGEEGKEEDEDGEEDNQGKDSDGEDDEDEEEKRARTRGAKRQRVAAAADTNVDDASAMRILKACDPAITVAALEDACASSGLRTQVAELCAALAQRTAEYEEQARNELAARVTDDVAQLMAMCKRRGVSHHSPKLKTLLRQLETCITEAN